VLSSRIPAIACLVFVFAAARPNTSPAPASATAKQQQHVVAAPGQNAPSTSDASQTGTNQVIPIKRELSDTELEELRHLKMERDVEDSVTKWAQSRFWWIALFGLLVGFVGVRALVREMIATELREATKAAAAAMSAADHTREVTKEVRADAEKYRELVSGFTKSAQTAAKKVADMEVRLQQVDTRILAEGGHAIAAADRQIASLAEQLNELSEVVKHLSEASAPSQAVVQRYENAVQARDREAASGTAEFNRNAQYTVYVYHHGPDSLTQPIAKNVVAELAAIGFKAADAVWEEKHRALVRDPVNIEYATGEVATAAKVSAVVEENMRKSGYHVTHAALKEAVNDPNQEQKDIWVFF
jgi:hypothetical protein